MIPAISVVMANYNGARYLGAALKSLQSQSFLDWELIFVDDGSSDNSVALASHFAAHDPRIRVVTHNGNSGPAATRNRAIELARGHYIAIFDSDDIMRPDRLEVLRERARSDRAAIIVDNMLVFSDGQRPGKSFLPRAYTNAARWIGLAEYIDSNQLYSRTPDLGYLKPMISLACLRETGIRYDERLRIGEDYDLIVRLMAAGLKMRTEPSAQYLYRKHPASISHRLQAPAIEALIDANARLQLGIDPAETDIHQAIRRREWSLRTMLSYDRVISLIKARDYAGAVSIGLKEPGIWPLLGRPIQARIGRLVKAAGHPRHFVTKPSTPVAR